MRPAGLLALVVAVGFARPSMAAMAEPGHPPDRRRVLLLTDAPGDPLMARIRAEVVSLGLDVVVRPAEGPIDTRTRSEHAVAAIRMLPARNGVEVWAADATSGRSLLRQAIVDDKPGGPDQTLITLQTAEVLRTSLFPHPPPAPAPIVIQAAPAQPSPSDVAVTARVGLLYGGAGGPAWQAWLSFQHLWTEHIGAAVEVSAPLHRGSLGGPEGTVDIGAVTAGAELLARFVSNGRRPFATAAVGAAFVSVLATGHASTSSAPLLSASTAVYTGLGYARAAVGWKASRRIAVGVDAVVGTTVAPIHFRFAGNDAGTWGMPVLGAALFGEFDWR